MTIEQYKAEIQQQLSPTRVLYRVRDGHLRLHIHPMEVRT